MILITVLHNMWYTERLNKEMDDYSENFNVTEEEIVTINSLSDVFDNTEIENN